MLLSLQHTVPPIPSMAKCWGARKSSAGRMQLHSLPCSGQRGDVVGQTPLLWHPTVTPPQDPDKVPPWKAAGWLGKGGRQLLLCRATQPSPKGQQPWVRATAMAEQQLFPWEPWGPPLSLLGTAGFPTWAGEKGICFNQPK